MSGKNTMERTSILKGLVLSLALLHLDAQAGPVTFFYEGVVTELAPDISPSAPFSTLEIGDLFSGNVTFDSGAEPSGEDPFAIFFDSIISASGTLDQIEFSGPVPGVNGILIGDDAGNGLFDQYSINFIGHYGNTISLPTVLQLVDPSATMFTDLSLPLTPPDISILSPENRTFRIGDIEAPLVSGQVIRLVPEPATFLLLSIGCLVLVRHRDTARKAMVAR